MKKVMLMMLVFASISLGETVKHGNLEYKEAEILGFEACTLEYKWSGNTLKKSVNDLIIEIPGYQEFNDAEALYKDKKWKEAGLAYKKAYAGMKKFKKTWKDYYIKNPDTDKGKRCLENYKSNWLKRLLEYRFDKCKEFYKNPPSELPKAETSEKKEQSTSTQPSTNTQENKDKKKCPKCRGCGRIKCNHYDENTHRRHTNYYEICSRCNGKGKVVNGYHYKEIRNKYGVVVKRRRITDYKSCPNCRPEFFDGRNIYVEWVCPHCAHNRYPRYTTCPFCNGKKKLTEAEIKRKQDAEVKNMKEATL